MNPPPAAGPLASCWLCGCPVSPGTRGKWPLGMALTVRDHDPTQENPSRDVTWECIDHRACLRRVMARVARVN